MLSSKIDSKAPLRLAGVYAISIFLDNGKKTFCIENMLKGYKTDIKFNKRSTALAMFLF